MLLIRILFAIDSLAAAGLVIFFFIGIADGSVSSFNIGLWLATLAALAVVLGGGFVLNKQGRRKAATALLLVLAIPAAMFALFFLLIIVFQPRWN